jgi:TonB family protein
MKTTKTFHRRFLLACFGFAVITLLVCNADTFGQGSPTNNVDEWVRIESPGKEFSVGIPASGYLVDNEDDSFRVIYENKDRSFTVTMDKMDDAKEKFRRWSEYYEDRDKRYRVVKSGDFLERFYESSSDDNEWHTFWVQVASARGIFHVSLRTRQADIDIAMRSLRSIRLGGKQIFDPAITNPVESRTIAIDSLKTDDIVLKALAEPEPKNLVMEKDLGDTGILDNDKRPYSRRIVILRKPKASFTQTAFSKNINGTVKLRATFLANGTIASIVLVRSLYKDLDQKAFEAARKIKFLPPEIDGKPVDITVYFDYNFTILPSRTPGQ